MVAWLCLYSCCACSSYAVAWVTCHFTLRSCRSRAFAIHYLHLFTTFQPPHLHQSVEFDVPSTAQFSPPQASLTQAPAANGRQEKKVEICRTGRLRLGTWAMHSMDTDTDTVWYRRSAVGFQWCPHAGQGEKHSSSPTSIECKCAAVTSADTMKLSSFTPLLSCFVFFVSIYIYVMSCDRDLSKAKKDNPKIRGHDLGFTALDILVSLCVWIAKMKRLLTHCVTFRGFSSIHWR